jgi:hypothetical protein
LTITEAFWKIRAYFFGRPPRIHAMWHRRHDEASCFSMTLHMTTLVLAGSLRQDALVLPKVLF